MKKYIFIGKEFFDASKTLMSYMYSENGERADWDSLEIEIRNKNTVHIRMATNKELTNYHKKLEQCINLLKSASN